MSKNSIYIGIDPGVSGGMVALYSNEIVAVSTSSFDRYMIRNWLENKSERYTRKSVYAVIEKVGGFIGEGKGSTKRNIASAHTMFTLGESYGQLCMALVCARISFREMFPRGWQETYDIDPRKEGETKPQFKNRLKKKAIELFPDEKITKDTCDAYILAHLCRSIYQ